MNNYLSKFSANLLVLVIAVICIGIISSRFYFRIDMTQDKVYTLSDGSKRIVENLAEPVTVKFYFSQSVKDIPQPFKTFGNRIEELLRELATYSKGKLEVDVVDPRPDSDDEVWARKYGIQGVQIASGDEAYLGAVFLSGENELAIPYLDPRQEEFLEYELAQAIVKLHQSTKPKLAIYSSIPLDSGPFDPRQHRNNRQEWSFFSSLRESFDITVLDADFEDFGPDLDVLVLFHPKELGENSLYAIDQYILRGGRVIVAVDPFSRLDLANHQQAMMQGVQLGEPDASSRLPRLFDAWGVAFKQDEMVGDPQRSTRINAGNQEINYPFFLSLTGDELNRSNRITANLRQMLLAEPGYLELNVDSKKVEAEILIQTTPSAGTLPTSMATFMGPDDLTRRLEVGEKSRVLAAMLKGRFTSAFTEAPSGAEGGDFLTESQQESLIVIVADIDFLHDSNAVDRIPFINQVIVRPRNDNIHFLVNAAELLGGNQDLIDVRTSGRVQRPFTRVRDLQLRAGERWKNEEEKLSRELQSLQQKLAELQSQRTDGNRTALSADQQREIQRFRQQEAEVRTRRREVRKNLREDIESLGHRLVAINLLVIPSIISGFGIFMFRRRAKNAKGGRK